ncbi:hypothetical protein GUITHDRAFT_93561 [Guillardia theta CCMP2712]|uniref:Purple acid phosphatase n=2 Tax=Guillardia theta TaxID=55529 RepID=L1JKZ8_GUITC|nr:hypothetical protein GUITHDRAFT_93561 [Guillardia theta CCMP2712]EKX48804.1 hypothetical protein GUITHDRAFT_93561 [Guillardia theta CCMP2712]|eukprot:XP_005835784.1 hypothetical protein GUITHDRAFT_93561 [Guillardia theta CCMP2712]
MYWIGMYNVDDDVTVVAPIKYQSVGGRYKGTITFQVVNPRKDTIFYLFQNDITSAVLVSKSNVVKFKNPNMPTGGRLAYTSKQDEMLVSWTANSVGGDSMMVQWGRTQDVLNMQAAVQVRTTYTREDMCGGDAAGKGFRDPGMFYSALMKGLEGGEEIFYRVGSEASGFSKVQSFKMPGPGSSSKISFFAFGDLGMHAPDESVQYSDSFPSLNTTEAMYSDMAADPSVAFVLHIGDISYARGFASVWDQFHKQIEDISSRIPWMVGIGNHERDWPGTGSYGRTDSEGECGVPFELRFPMPYFGNSSAPKKALDKPWYSFERGPVHVVVLSSEHEYKMQTAWLLADLKSVDRKVTPWIVVSAHRPMYISSTNWDEPDGDHVLGDRMIEEWEEIFMEFQVNVVLTAHHHSYQRSCPVYKGKCVRPAGPGVYAAPIYMIIGMGGFASCYNIQEPQPEIFEVVDAINHGYIKVVADLDSFRVDYVHGDDRAVHDSFTLQFPRSILKEQPGEKVMSSRVKRVREAMNRRRMYNDAKTRLKRKFAADDHVVE